MLESSEESGLERADARPSQRYVDHALISACSKPRLLHKAVGLENRHSLVACRCTRTSQLSSGTVCAAGVIQSACTAQQGPPYARKRAHGSHRDDGLRRGRHPAQSYEFTTGYRPPRGSLCTPHESYHLPGPAGAAGDRLGIISGFVHHPRHLISDCVSRSDPVGLGPAAVGLSY